MLTDQKIIKLHRRLPEIQNRLKNVTSEITNLSKKQSELAKFCRFISRVTEIHEGVPLSIGPFFTRALSEEHTRYANHHVHPDDTEMRAKNMRWVVRFLNHPLPNIDGITNFSVACVLNNIKNRRTAIELSKKWIIGGQKWLEEYNNDQK